MFTHVEMAPADPILGLTEAFKRDPHPRKINLGAGVYKDADGHVPVLQSVKRAEERLWRDETSKNYLPIAGSEAFAAHVQRLLFGPEHQVVRSGRAVSAHTPGGTGALRVAGELVRLLSPEATLWVSDPTWANHRNIFASSGLTIRTYPYYDAAHHGLAFDAMMAALAHVKAPDVVLLHACCHNPSGIDPTPEQWQALAELAHRQGFLPLFDFAYQGFGRGIAEDAAPLRLFVEACDELLIANSFSKNFGLYNERVGGLTVVAGDASTASKVLSQVKVRIRANYSNPPAHGGAIVCTILDDAQLRALWEDEVSTMRQRIHSMRHVFVQTLADLGVTQDFSFIAQQQGMFSFSGLSKEQVAALRRDYGIYIVDSGRLNVAGMTEQNMPYLCQAIANVVA